MQKFSEIKNRFLVLGLLSIIVLALLVSGSTYLINQNLTSQFIDKYLEDESVQLINLRIAVEDTLLQVQTGDINQPVEVNNSRLLEGLSDHVNQREAVYAVVIGKDGQRIEYKNPDKENEMIVLEGVDQQNESANPMNELISRPKINSFMDEGSFKKFYEIQIPVMKDGSVSGTIKVYMSHNDIVKRVAPMLDHIHQVVSLASIVGGGLFLLVGFIIFYLVHSARILQIKMDEEKHLAAVGTIAAGMAHEIKNPLNAIGLNLQMIQQKLKGTLVEEEYVIKKVNSALLESKRLENLLNGFLHYSKQDEPFEKIKVNQVIENCIELLKVEADFKKISLSFSKKSNAEIFAGPSKIKQIIINVLLNAIQHTHSGGIDILSSTEVLNHKEFLVLLIKDTGSGIPVKEQSKIFDMFYTTRPSGTGMGLHVVQTLLEEIEGKISLESSDEKGSTFKITIPLVDK